MKGIKLSIWIIGLINIVFIVNYTLTDKKIDAVRISCILLYLTMLFVHILSYKKAKRKAKGDELINSLLS